MWIGLINPNKIDCSNETCDSQLVWDNDAQDTFVWASIYTIGVTTNQAVSSGYECLRITQSTYGIDDMRCSNKFHFVCQKELV